MVELPAPICCTHVSVVLGRFRERGLVDYAPGRALVPDPDAPRAFVYASANA